MQEIGGYIELDTYRLPMLHESASAFNCGRNALACLLKTRQVKKLWLPKFNCDSITGVCDREGVSYSFYSVGFDFLPEQELSLGQGEWFYLINYYGQLGNNKIMQYVARYERVIVDQAQSYFQAPLPGVDTIYTCRKYFGVPDGAFLYSDAELPKELPVDESFDRMRFLLGRFERTASEFYSLYAANNELFRNEPVKRMSKLTRNLLHAIDYAQVLQVRQENYLLLHEKLRDINQLSLCQEPGTFMYPLFIENGGALRKKLQQRQIYIPTLWPEVFDICTPQDAEYQMAANILPLPIDQRYGPTEMTMIVEELKKCLTI